VVEGLASALNGPERDAARARSIIRSFITEISLTPDEESLKAESNSKANFRIKVTGSLTALFGQVDADLSIQRSTGTSTALDGQPATFQYYFDLNGEIAEKVPGTYADIALLSRLLDSSNSPIARSDLVRVLGGLGDENSPATLLARARRAFKRLAAQGRIRAVKIGRGALWVWRDSEVSDAEWLRRAKVGGCATFAPPPPPPPMALSSSVVTLEWSLPPGYMQG
jgi:hypothetical protein